MAITLCVKPYCRQFRQPLLTAHGYWHWREGLLVRLEDNSGRVGFGEIAPIPWFGSETLAQAAAFCQNQATVITDPLPIPDTLPATQFGFGAALEQLRASPQSARPQAPQPAALCGLLPTGAPALTAWKPLWQPGTRTFKWKIGVAPITQELAWLETLMQSLPATGRLRLDANGGLTMTEAEDWLAVCDRLNAAPDIASIEYLEQPLAPSQIAAMQQLANRFKTAIALDESVATAHQLHQHYRQGWRGLMVVKPAIAGCPHRLRTFWQQHTPHLVFSSAFETVVGRQIALALAAEYDQHVAPVPSLALGFGTLGWFEDDWDTLTPAQLWDYL